MGIELLALLKGAGGGGPPKPPMPGMDQSQPLPPGAGMPSGQEQNMLRQPSAFSNIKAAMNGGEGEHDAFSGILRALGL